MIIAALFLGAVACYFASLFVLKYFRLLKFSAQMPGPRGLPLLGNALELANKSSLEFVQILANYIADHGKTLRIWLGHELLILTVDPKDVEGVLSSTKVITKSADYNFLKPWLGTGLLTSSGSKWLTRRKIITPAFHFGILEDFVSIFDKHTTILAEKLRKYEGQEDFDIFPLTALCTLDIICESAMGTQLNAQNDLDSEYVRNVNELANIIHHRSYNVQHRFAPLFCLTSTYWRQKKLLAKLHNFTDNVIKARRETLMGNPNILEQYDEELGKKKKMALLDILLQSKVAEKPLSNLDIREEIDTFMFEGHDTTNSAIAFALLNIAKRPDIQQKCIDEIRDVIGDDLSRPVDMKTLNELKYLELVLKESLRLYPSVPIMGREVTEEVEINSRKYPVGASIIIMPYFMGRHPDLWENPLEFIPERFSVETTAERFNPYSYIPFSAGSRNCIGQKFAMLEIKSTVSKLLRHYKLSVSADYTSLDSLELVIKSKNGVQIRLETRQYAEE